MTFGGGLKSAMETHLMSATAWTQLSGHLAADQLAVVVGQVNVIGYWKWMFVAPQVKGSLFWDGNSR